MSARPHTFEADPGPDTDISFWHTATEPSFEPLLRPDTRVERPLAACGGDCSQGRTACPSPAVCLGLHRVPVITRVVQRRSAAEVAADRRVQRAARRVRFFRGAFWWIATAALAAAALTVTAKSAHAADVETTATIAAVADTGTTVIAVATGVGYEANALMAHPVAFAAISAGKILAPRAMRDVPDQVRKPVLRAWTAAWGGVSVSNVLVLGGVAVTCPLCVGAAAAGVIWALTGEDAPADASEPGAQLAMAAAPEVMP